MKNYRQRQFKKRVYYFFTDANRVPILGTRSSHLGSVESLSGVAPVMMQKYNNERQITEPKAEYWEVEV